MIFTDQSVDDDSPIESLSQKTQISIKRLYNILDGEVDITIDEMAEIAHALDAKWTIKLKKNDSKR